MLGVGRAIVAKSGCAELHEIRSVSFAEEAAQPFPVAAGAGGTGCGRLDLVAFQQACSARARTKGHFRRTGHASRRSAEAGARAGATAAAASGCADSTAPHY